MDDDRVPAEVSPPQHQMRIETTSIRMADGVSLAATLYMPDSLASEERFPAILEFLPYRKDDGTSASDRARYEYFARRGYVGARVDIRGTGSSDGVADDQYSVQEVQDATGLISWLAEQPWCSGKVGMWGISYGGFNSIQVAKARPPALKAIIAIDATDDVYTDDVTFWNGALQFEALGRYPLAMIARNMLPAYPDYDATSRAACDRFSNPHEPWLARWLSEQRDGAYWRRQSLRPNYDAIEVPTFLIGGWLDGYTDSIPRMLENLRAPTKAIIGPWPHAWPQEAIPGPRIDALYEALRWWDHWLKGRDTGVMNDPPLALYLQHYYPPERDIERIPGKWCYENTWPIHTGEQVAWYLQPDGGLAPYTATISETFSLDYKATVGTSNRYRIGHSPVELVTDQRADDAYSMSFTSPPLARALEILGFPGVVLLAEASAPIANWIVRLSDIAPDGSSQLVSKGVLNGTHRNSHASPEHLKPGTVYELKIDLNATSWEFPAGHRIRLSVCNADFPNLWPSPYRMTTCLHVGDAQPSRVVLPVRMGPSVTNQRSPIKLRQGSGLDASNQPRPARDANARWQVTRDELGQTTSILREIGSVDPNRDGSPRTISTTHRWICTASDLAPANAKLSATFQQDVSHDIHITSVHAFLTIESDEETFRLTVRRELRRDGEVLKADTRATSIPRDHL